MDKFLIEYNQIIDKLNKCITDANRKRIQDDLDILLNTIHNNNYVLNESFYSEESDIETFSDIITKKGVKGYQPYYNYPYIEQTDFNQSLYDMKSIQVLKLIKKSSDGSVRLKTSQEFVKLFLSQSTGYNGLLIYHGVGVGKTCASISSIEPIKNNYRKIYILSPSLEDNWRDEIFNVNKELSKTNSNINVQCTGNIYSKLVTDLMPKPINITDDITYRRFIKYIDENKITYKEFNIFSQLKLSTTKDSQKDELVLRNIKEKLDVHFENLKKKIRKIVKEKIDANYSFYGYLQFAKSVLNRIENLKFEYQKIDYIREKYSKCVFVLDEIQYIKSNVVERNMEEGGDNHDEIEEGLDKQKSKKILEVLDYIARYGENNKMLLLSATPMYDTSKEIIQILNLLLRNDKKAPILGERTNKYHIKTSNGDQKYIFDKYGSLTEDGSWILKNKSIGYISYLKGIDPENFPKKIWPNKERLSNIDIDIDLYNSEIKNIDKFGEVIEEAQRINFRDLKIVEAVMEKEQEEQYMKIDNKSSGFKIRLQQLSNMVFPKGSSYENCIKKTGKSFEIYRDGILDDNSLFLQKENISRFSSKFSKIIECVNKSIGIVFIHSTWLSYGIETLALALELQGYREFSLKNTNNIRNRLINNPYNNYRVINGENSPTVEEEISVSSEKKVAKYIILSGDVKNKTELIRIITGDDDRFPNKEGESIKIILATINVGISFKRVRQIHVMNAWWHLNRLEQIIGRGIRNQSHDSLDELYRNVTVFFYACSYKMIESKVTFNGHQETFDEHMYRIAYLKDKSISEVESLLRKNAVDCQLNKNINTIKIHKNNLSEIDVIDSFGEKYKYTINDIFIKDNLYEDPSNKFNCIGNLNSDTPITTPKIIKENIYHKNEIFGLLGLENDIKLLFNTSILNYPKYSYKLDDIISLLKSKYKNDDILLALNDLIDNKIIFTDIFGRVGYLIYNNGYYVFQPNKEIDFPNNMSDIKIPINIRDQLVKVYPNKKTIINTNNYNEVRLDILNNIQRPIDEEINIQELFSFLYETPPVSDTIPIFTTNKGWYPNKYNKLSNSLIKDELKSTQDKNIYFYNGEVILSLKDIYISKLYSYINKSSDVVKKKLCRVVIKASNSDNDDKYLKEFKKPKYQYISIPKFNLETEEWELPTGIPKSGEIIKMDGYDGEYPILNLISNILENQGLLIQKKDNYSFITSNSELDVVYRNTYLKDDNWKNNYLFYRIVEKTPDFKVEQSIFGSFLKEKIRISSKNNHLIIKYVSDYDETHNESLNVILDNGIYSFTKLNDKLVDKIRESKTEILSKIDLTVKYLNEENSLIDGRFIFTLINTYDGKIFINFNKTHKIFGFNDGEDYEFIPIEQKFELKSTQQPKISFIKENIQIKDKSINIHPIPMNRNNFGQVIGFNTFDRIKQKYLNKIIVYKGAKETREINKGQVCGSFDIPTLIRIIDILGIKYRGAVICRYISYNKQCKKFTKKSQISEFVKEKELNISNIAKSGECRDFNIPKPDLCEFLQYLLIHEQLNSSNLTEQHKNSDKNKENKTYFISNNYKYFCSLSVKADKIVQIVKEKQF